MRLHGFAISGALVLSASAFPAAAAVYTVGAFATPGDCTHLTVQAAVNAAASNPGSDEIRISNSQNYTAQAILIRNQNLTLSGGFDDCYPLAPVGRTRLSGNGGSADSVIMVRGFGDVVLSNLEITDGDETGYGGGVEISEGPHALVELHNVRLAQNRAGKGGGLSLSNGFSDNIADVNLLIGDRTEIAFNSATQSGGGMHCEKASITMTGSASYLFFNSAGTHGGGLRAEDCAVWIASNGVLPLSGAVTLNNAAQNGGGISASGPRSIVKLFNTDPAVPTTINNNSAGGSGGGIEVALGARVNAFDIAILNNSARSGGGGVSVYDGDGVAPDRAIFGMQGTLNGAPPGALNCASSADCNRLSGNIARDANGVAQPGAALWVRTVNSGLAGVELYGTRLDGNEGRTLIQTAAEYFNTMTVLLDGTLLVDNTVSEALIYAPDRDAAARILASTIAGNAIGGPATIRSVGLNASLQRSIVWQPGERLIDIVNGSLASSALLHVLSNDFTGIDFSPTFAQVDPRFVAVDSGNYRLRSVSPALEFAPATAGDHTRDHQARAIDLPLIANVFGSQDLGAYEMAVDLDVIFADGFD